MTNKPKTTEREDLPYKIEIPCLKCEKIMHHQLAYKKDFTHLQRLKEKQVYFCPNCETSTFMTNNKNKDEIKAKMEELDTLMAAAVFSGEERTTRKIEHICVNITAHHPIDRMRSLPEQVLEYYQKRGWELCAVNDIYYFFKKQP